MVRRAFAVVALLGLGVIAIATVLFFTGDEPSGKDQMLLYAGVVPLLIGSFGFVMHYALGILWSPRIRDWDIQ